MTRTRGILVDCISEETGLEKKQLYDVLHRILTRITESLARGDKVELRQFGVFEIRFRKARIGRNPRKPKSDMVIAPGPVVKFRSGKEMTAQISKLKFKKNR